MSSGLSEAAIALFRQGQKLLEAKRAGEAQTCFDRALALHPGSCELWNAYGALLADHGRPAEAIQAYDRACALAPTDPAPLYNRGNALQQLNRHALAVESYDTALGRDPGLIAAWNNRGTSLLALQKHDEALTSFQRVLQSHPAAAQVWNNCGIALAGLNRQDEALAAYDQAGVHDPGFARAWDNRGMLLRAMARPDDALASHERALASDPNLASAWFNRGNVLRESRRGRDALASYERGLAIQPFHTAGWINRAIALRDLKQIEEALASYGRALEFEPDCTEALYGRGLTAWVEKQDYGSALADLERAVQLDPDFPYAAGALLLVRQYGGDWRDFDADAARIDAGVRAGKPVAEPFLYQAISSAPADLQACSVIHARHRYPQGPATPALAPRAKGKIRIGYVSGEFREQATAYLTAGLYEAHDRSRFDVTGFDNGGSDHSALRQRLDASFDALVDIAGLSDAQAAQAIAARGIDILVNLNGYFGDHRMGVFAQRPAPIQVNYLGFPATLGAPYIDYILADRIVIPPGEEGFYTEQVVRLPHSYQINDSRRAIAKDIPTPAQCGLPQNGFVFCNFNTSYKLTPDTFASWMRILQQTPNSVLWLLEGIPQFAENLRQQAARAGIAADRLIFAPLVPLDAHLARLGLADLSLDSLPYNAHTTASDALWAAVPLITLQGRAFAGRVAASLLHAIGLSDLITYSAQDYEALAVRLAKDTAALNSLRARLANNRLTTPLFDTIGFTRQIEAAYETMVANHARGLPPRGFDVP